MTFEQFSCLVSEIKSKAHNEPRGAGIPKHPMYTLFGTITSYCFLHNIFLVESH